jgi:hypothetical protein
MGRRDRNTYAERSRPPSLAALIRILAGEGKEGSVWFSG